MRKAIRGPKVTAEEQVLYMAFELGVARWKVVGRDGCKHRFYNVNPHEYAVRIPEILARAKEKFGLPQDCRVICCYEAGRDGFWLHRYLVSLGIEHVIVDPSSIEVPQGRRRAKTDRVDAEKLVGMLKRFCRGDEEHVFKLVEVPTEQQEDEMRLHRERERCVSERTGHMNRIRGLLTGQGVAIDNWKHVDAYFIERVVKWNGQKLGERLQEELKRELDRLRLVDEQIKEIDKELHELMKEENPNEAVQKMQRLHGMRGIGVHGARILVMECFGWRTFAGGKQVGAYAGLTGCPYSSGESQREQGISKSGNYRIRTLMVELAWGWLRFQPHSQLSRWFLENFAQKKRNRRIGIVALARKLLVALWRYVEFGVVPEGAALASPSPRRD